jgi:hypothetical protein
MAIQSKRCTENTKLGNFSRITLSWNSFLSELNGGLYFSILEFIFEIKGMKEDTMPNEANLNFYM